VFGHDTTTNVQQQEGTEEKIATKFQQQEGTEERTALSEAR
jgi:hypothetical protein